VTVARQDGPVGDPEGGAPVLGADDPRAAERNVVALGWVAFAGGMAQDMIQPVLPLFYASVLGLRKEFIGLIEGSLTTAVSLMRFGAGVLSDRLGRRKAVVFAGYALSAAGRLGLGFAASGASAFGLRIADGVGKGLKDAPRDALVASSAGRRRLGLAFGIQRALDTSGSVAGPLVAYALLRWWGEHPQSYRNLFLVAGCLAAAPLLIIGLWVRERRTPVQRQHVDRKSLRGAFAAFLVVQLVFTLGNSSDAFLILRAENAGMTPALIPVAYALMNLTSAAAAIPAGRLSDRIGRRRAIRLGWGVYALAYAGFALASSPGMVWGLFALYGFYYALSEGAGKAMVADLVPEQRRGSAYGLYNASVGIAALPASVLAGVLWQRLSPAAPFWLGAALAAIAALALGLIPRGDRITAPETA